MAKWYASARPSGLLVVRTKRAVGFTARQEEIDLPVDEPEDDGDVDAVAYNYVDNRDIVTGDYAPRW